MKRVKIRFRKTQLRSKSKGYELGRNQEVAPTYYRAPCRSDLPVAIRIQPPGRDQVFETE